MKIELPELCLVLLVGASGAGKSSFARKHFKTTEVVSSDFCRGLVSDDENDQEATKDAFELLKDIAGKRLARGKLTLVDATNVRSDARKPLLALARAHDVSAAAIVLNLPESVCSERNRGRAERGFGPHVVRGQVRQLRQSLSKLKAEGFRYVHVASSAEEVDAISIERKPLCSNRKSEHGPFDIIGDVHGCALELEALLTQLGYRIERGSRLPFGYRASHAEGRRAIFLGDLVDRGPGITSVLRLVMSMVQDGVALCVPGNHEHKLLRKLKGKNIKVTHGLAATLAQLETEPADFRERVCAFIDELVGHLVLDDGKLVVAHAGMKETLQGRASARVRSFALYGETTGETDEFGLPVRYDWASEYRGRALVVYGHTPVVESAWVNGTINIDNGCVFGGKLTALRYPERELVSVPAAGMYYEPAKPLASRAERSSTAEEERGDLLDLDDVSGKRAVQTSLRGRVTVREENARAALEVMSRFAIDPRFLIYLPPTMSPPATSPLEGLLEHPGEAFGYFRQQGVGRVVCEEKHMGSRAVLVVCRSEAEARARFGLGGRLGAVYTRTGRPFFSDASVEAQLLERVRAALEQAKSWEFLATSWVCLDCELMPWSAKAHELLRVQYAPVGAAARAALSSASSALARAAERGLDVAELATQVRARADAAGRYVEAYRRYCWSVGSVGDLKLAPFHLLASEGSVHTERDHLWHLQALAPLIDADPQLLLATRHLVVDVTEAGSEHEGTAFWETLTERGGEGMVVKPLSFVARGPRGLVQPAVKVRGREYLRIIYGPEYALPANLVRLRERGLSAKRSLALSEFALGIEGLERFVRREPLYRVHECVFGVLALESEPVDPRL